MSKKKVKTEEELLQDALVPVEEQPYEIPSHWQWVRLVPGLAECLDKYRKPINAKERETRKGDIPYYGATGQVGWIDDYLTDEELVLLGEDGAPFFEPNKPKAYMIKGKAWANNHVHLLRAIKERGDNRYLLHYLNSFNYKGFVNGTTRLKLNQANMNNIPIPLPPLDEQKRISEKIELMLDKINQSKQLIEEAKQTFELRRAAILDKAFSGELTKKWREESVNGFTVNWLTKSLEDVCVGIFDCPHSTPQYIDEGIPAIRTSDVGFMKINLIAARRVSIEEFNARTSRVIPEIGDIIYCREGTIGNAGIVEEGSMCLAQRVVLFRANEEIIIPRFLCYMLNSPLVLKQVFANISQTTSPRINVGQLKKLQLVVPSLKEQKVIVSMLDKLISLENEFISKFEENSHIDVVENSILSKAFKGEL